MKDLENTVEIINDGDDVIVRYAGVVYSVKELFYIPEEYVLCSNDEACEAVQEFLDS